MAFEMFWATPIYWGNIEDEEDGKELLPKLTDEVSSSMEKYELNRPWDDGMLTSFRTHWKKEDSEEGRHNMFLESCPLLKSYVNRHVDRFIEFFDRYKTFSKYEIMESWFNKGEKHSYQNYHIHAGADISGVYYHQTNGKDGNITFRTDSLGIRSSKIYPYYDMSQEPRKGKIL